MLLFNYYAIVNRVVDGDTVNLTIDLGFRMTMTANCRLAEINAPELTSADYDERILAHKAKDFLTQKLPVGTKILVESKGLDKYGRPVVKLWFDKEESSINHQMIQNKLANTYLL